MAETLTPQQKMAITNRGGKLLVSAAAGSGKTKVLVDRLLSYLTDPVNPANLDDFLIITYTKAAASELRGKIAAKLTQAIAEDPSNHHLQQQMQRLYLAKISTVHAFCTDLLREYAYRLDISADFRVADENESMQLRLDVVEQILDAAYETAEQNQPFQAFISTQGLGRDDRQIPEIILKVHSSAMCHLQPDAWLENCLSSSAASDATDAAQTVWGNFLITDLHHYLDQQIDALSNCERCASAADEMEKPTALLHETVVQLVTLRNCTTWDEIVKHREIDYGRLIFSKKITDINLAEQIKAVRSACKKGLDKKLRSFSSDSAQVLQDLRTSGEAVSGLITLVRQFISAYDALKKRHRILDFGDLEQKTLDLLLGKYRSSPTSVADEIGRRYREIMVDEYQDSNGVQDAIFSALTRQRYNCFMVGDVKQSIYQFRLADPGIFIEKYNAFSPAHVASDGESRKVILSSNFRSSGGVISAVNDVFATCMSPEIGGVEYGEEEMLHEGIPHIPLGQPEVELYGITVCEDTYAEEAAFVAGRIRQLLDGDSMVRQGDTLRRIKPEDIAILLRSPGSVGGEFRYALECCGIPCATSDGSDLLQSEEIEFLRSILQIISNPLQDIPLTAVLTSRVFLFTAEELAQLRGQNRRDSVYELLQKADTVKAKSFLMLLSELRMDAKFYTVAQLLDCILVKTKGDCIFASMDDGAERTENIQAFCQIAAEYETNGRKDLEQFLAYLDSMSIKGFPRTGTQKNSGAVTILSIHKSKGLEYPVVFLAGLSRRFNQESANAQVLCDKELGIGLCSVDTKQRIRYPTIAKKAIAAKILHDSISEELRVLYVAMTRARDRLIMTYADKNLEGDLQDIAMRMDMSGRSLLTSEVSCPGEWVLQTALRRTEAGAFFALCGTPDKVFYKEPIWKIQVISAVNTALADSNAACAEFTLSQEQIQYVKEALCFSYPHIKATQIPSKHTATQLKGREKDRESAQNAKETKSEAYIFRKPVFLSAEKRGMEYGKAMHAVMQYICYASCSDITSVEQEVHRLVSRKLISQSQAEMVNCRKIVRIFQTPLGEKLKSANTVLREFKFSILDDAAQYYPEVENEQILLQGVVDCALMEPDGITVIDFKTDYVTEETLTAVAHKYRPQVTAYAKALEKIYCKPVKSAQLYFFALDRFIELLV